MGTMITPEQALAAAQGVRQRSIAILRSLPDEDAERPVPTCPGWTVKDLACHLYGIPDDIIHGRMENVGSDAWTLAQVERSRDLSLSEIADRWEALAVRFDEIHLMTPFPVNLQLVMDFVTHEHDLRLATGQAGAQDDGAVTIGLAYLLINLRKFNPELAASFDAMEVSDFEKLRVLSGRRCARQVAEAGLRVEDIDAFLAITPMSMTTEVIDESA